MHEKPFLLLVEDEVVLLQLMALELQDSFCVLEASSFEQALALIDPGRGLMAVATDLSLLPGRNGAELLVAVAERVPECGRVLMSGSHDGYAISHALRTGAAHRFLHKPWPPGALRAAVVEACAVAQRSAFTANRAFRQTVPSPLALEA